MTLVAVRLFPFMSMISLYANLPTSRMRWPFVTLFLVNSRSCGLNTITWCQSTCSSNSPGCFPLHKEKFNRFQFNFWQIQLETNVWNYMRKLCVATLKVTIGCSMEPLWLGCAPTRPSSFIVFIAANWFKINLNFNELAHLIGQTLKNYFFPVAPTAHWNHVGPIHCSWFECFPIN